MKRIALFCAVAVAGLLAPSAKADTFDISFNGGPLGYSGSGVFTATNAGDVYLINGVVSGSVTDPVFGTSSIVGLSNYLAPDQLLTFPSTSYFDDSGISFSLANGVSINLFYDGSDESALQSNPNGDIAELVTDSVTAVTPEPSSFVLLGTAALLGIADLRRRRQAAA